MHILGVRSVDQVLRGSLVEVFPKQRHLIGFNFEDLLLESSEFSVLSQIFSTALRIESVYQGYHLYRFNPRPNHLSYHIPKVKVH